MQRRQRVERVCRDGGVCVDALIRGKQSMKFPLPEHFDLLQSMTPNLCLFLFPPIFVFVLLIYCACDSSPTTSASFTSIYIDI